MLTCIGSAGVAMKTLLVKPGVEFMEKALSEPWPSELSYLEKLHRQPVLFLRALVSFQVFAPSSLLAVGSCLEELGEDVEYLDIPLEFGISLREEQSKRKHEKIGEYIARGGYDIVGISCTCSSEYLAARRVAETVKRVSEDITVIAGGYHGASEACALMETIPAIDVVVLSDFEPVAGQLYSSFSGKVPMDSIPNLLYRENGTIHASERKYIKIKAEDLPVYDYSLVKKYIRKYSTFMIEASRGCPYDCTFCQEKVLRQSYTTKDAPVAVDEIIDAANYLAQFVGPLNFLYSDPLWGLNPKWVRDFCLQLAGRRDEIVSDVFGWTILARIGQFNDETLSLMKKAGCVSIGYGVESLSPRMLRMMNKTSDPQKYITSVFDTVEKTLRNDMHAMLFNILGIPGETPSTIEETLNSLRKLPLEDENVLLIFSLAFPLRGTLLYEQIHDSQFVGNHGMRIHDEYTWEKSYIPLLSMLFDPSKELSASQLVDTFLDLEQGTLGIPSPFALYRMVQSHEKRIEILKYLEAMLDKDEISPEEIIECARIIRMATSSRRYFPQSPSGYSSSP